MAEPIFSCPLPSPENPLANLPLHFNASKPSRKRKPNKTRSVAAVRARLLFLQGFTPNQIRQRIDGDWRAIAREARIPHSTQAMRR